VKLQLKQITWLIRLSAKRPFCDKLVNKSLLAVLCNRVVCGHGMCNVRTRTSVSNSGEFVPNLGISRILGKNQEF